MPLPDHVAYHTPDAPYVHPIHRFVRHSFQQNRADTSPRLVLAALNAGYKFIELLDAARTPDSPAHKSIVTFLEQRGPPKQPPKRLRAKAKRLEKERAKKARKAAREAGTADADGASGAETGRPPVIVRRIIPGSEKLSPEGVLTHLYEYVPGSPPRPLADIPGGIRRVPKFVAEASGIPFLRMGKPQSPILSRAIRLKGQKRRHRAQVASVLLREEINFVAQEDAWEANLVRALKEGPSNAATTAFLRDAAREPTYRNAVATAISYLNAQLNVETADLLARARGFLQIVDRERELAEKEEKERQTRREEEG